MNALSFNRQRLSAAAAILGVVVGSAALAARFEPTPVDIKPKQPVQSQRKAPIDLEQQAKERRQGQVLPGDPAPVGQGAPIASTKPVGPNPAPTPPTPTPAEAAPGVKVAAITPAGSESETPIHVKAMPMPAPSEAGVVPNPPPAAGYSPARVKVSDGDLSQAEWRSSVGGWQPIKPGQTSDARVEIRAGLDSDIVLTVDDSVEVRIARLGRVAIERATEHDGSVTISIVLSRGMIAVSPVAGARPATESRWLARVRTPDRSLALTAPAELTYDAFSGTRVRLAGSPSK